MGKPMGTVSAQIALKLAVAFIAHAVLPNSQATTLGTLDYVFNSHR